MANPESKRGGGSASTSAKAADDNRAGKGLRTIRDHHRSKTGQEAQEPHQHRPNHHHRDRDRDPDRQRSRDHGREREQQDQQKQLDRHRSSRGNEFFHEKHTWTFTWGRGGYGTLERHEFDHPHDGHRTDQDRRQAAHQSRSSRPNVSRANTKRQSQAVPPPRRMVRFTLKDADRQRTLDCMAKEGITAAQLEGMLQARERKKKRHSKSRYIFRVYVNGEMLAPDAKIPHDAPEIWYRAADSMETLTRWKLSLWKNTSNSLLDAAFAHLLVEAIESGSTVGELRVVVADFLGVVDANRVVLIARDGVRSGLLLGNDWEVRQVSSWLCRWISIDVAPQDSYVVLRGLGREYVFHPGHDDFEKGLEVKALKEYMNRRMLRKVTHHGPSQFASLWRNIVLRHGDRQLASFSPVVWGATYDFELPRDAAEVFSEEESWLLKATKECMICVEEKKLCDFPVKLTAACKHEALSCKDCVRQWLHEGVRSRTWDRLNCPECPEALQFEDVKCYASRETFARYDTLATRSALQGIPDFRWCLSTSCTSGQIHDPACEKFECRACGSSHCTRHNMPSHDGETCDEYDRRNRQREEDQRASEAMVRKISKLCPKCKMDVQKSMGCNHMTCRCGHEWCWVCFEPFTKNRYDFLFCQHKITCVERDPFAVRANPDVVHHPPAPPADAVAPNRNDNNNDNNPRGDNNNNTQQQENVLRDNGLPRQRRQRFRTPGPEIRADENVALDVDNLTGSFQQGRGAAFNFQRLRAAAHRPHQRREPRFQGPEERLAWIRQLREAERPRSPD